DLRLGFDLSHLRFADSHSCADNLAQPHWGCHFRNNCWFDVAIYPTALWPQPRQRIRSVCRNPGRCDRPDYLLQHRTDGYCTRPLKSVMGYWEFRALRGFEAALLAGQFELCLGSRTSLIQACPLQCCDEGCFVAFGCDCRVVPDRRSPKEDQRRD